MNFIIHLGNIYVYFIKSLVILGIFYMNWKAHRFYFYFCFIVHDACRFLSGNTSVLKHLLKNRDGISCESEGIASAWGSSAQKIHMEDRGDGGGEVSVVL